MIKKDNKKDDIKEKETVKKKRVKVKAKSIKEENSDSKRIINFSLVEMIVIVVIVSIVVGIASGYLVFKNYGFISKQTNIKTENTELNEFTKTYNEIIDKYYKDIDKEKLIDSAIDGMLNYLDGYTDYLDEDTTSDLQTRLNGEYKGIGVEISNNIDGNVVIVTVFPGTPADKAGLKVGDIISKVNEESMLGKSSSDVANTIKGSNVEEITITYLRGEEENTIKIDIKEVIIPSVESKVLENNIGYIGISTFSATTFAQTRDALNELESKNIESLIIDLRSNTGGYLSSAKTIADLFLEKGKIIYQLKYKDGSIKKYEATKKTSTDYKIVVLINGASASASEILAAALQESYGATLVGTKSFGKGTIQETEELNSGAMIKYTSAYWLTPNGNSINELGIKPDIEVTHDGKEEDNQLKRAIEALQ